MRHTVPLQSMDARTPDRRAQSAFYKEDSLRPIDQWIDYFEGSPGPTYLEAPCPDAWLEAVAGRR
jgi:hypothetical protein